MIGKTALVTILTASLTAPAAIAAPMNWSAELAPAEAAEGDVSGATGMAEGTVDDETGEVSYTITYEGLTGPATAMHFHGPAEAGEDAGVALPIEMGDGSPVEGEAEAGPDQVGQMMDGKWYVNIHTDANPGGEIRGQVELDQ